MKKIIGIIAVLAIVGIGVISLGNNKKPLKDSPTAASTKSSQPSAPNAAATLIIGDPNAKTTIVEYADFQCPKCNKFFKGAEQNIRKDFVETGKAKIEYRTLVTIGPESKNPAAGAYCANDQGKFTAFHDAVYGYMYDNYYSTGKSGENVGALSSENVKKIAGTVGVDQRAFDSCLDGGKYTKTVDDVIAAAAPVASTPTILVGSQKVEGAQPYSTFKTLLDSLQQG